MTFRKLKKSFWETITICSGVILLSAVLIPFAGILPVALPDLVLLATAVTALRDFDDQITIDASGICCRKRGAKLWSYSWGQIKALKKCTIRHHPALALVLDEEAEKTLADRTSVSFQLCEEAKEALKQYYFPN